MHAIYLTIRHERSRPNKQWSNALKLLQRKQLFKSKHLSSCGSVLACALSKHTIPAQLLCCFYSFVQIVSINRIKCPKIKITSQAQRSAFPENRFIRILQRLDVSKIFDETKIACREKKCILGIELKYPETDRF